MMKYYSNLLVSLIVLATGLPISVTAEGTKQLEPTRYDFTKVRINKTAAYNNFANYNSTTSERLCVRIGTIGERICFGTGAWGGGNMQLKIRDPNDFLVFGPFNLSNTPGDPGFIVTYDQAVAGPNIVDPAGYPPLVFTAATTGDYYFEFDFSGNPNRDFQYFDITVVDALNHPINGRVWSQSWQLYAGQYNAESGSRTTMYIYSGDSVVTGLYFNGLKAEGFEMYANSYGCQAPPVPFGTAIKSMPGRIEAPEFKVFLNDPDSLQFPTGNIDLVIPGSILIDPDCSGLFGITYDVSRSGIVQVMIELNPLPGQQPEDIVIFDTVTAGTNTLYWDGYDGLGQKVLNGTPVFISLTYLNGITNFLIFDALSNQNGYVATIVRPSGQTAVLLWDDTNLPGGTAENVGCITAPPFSGCHTWFGTQASGTGNDNTINTWWYSRETAPYQSMTRYAINTTYEFYPTMCDHDTIYLEGTMITQPGNYSFTFQSALTGCDSVRLYHVTSLPTPVVNLGPDLTICTGATHSFDAGAGAGYTYRWDNLSTGMNGISTQRIFTTGTAGIYRAIVTNPIGCDDGDTVTLSLFPVAHVLNNPPSEAICNGQSTNILLISDVPGTTFTWTATASSGQITGYSNSVVPGTTINQNLFNSGNADGWVKYHIIPSANGCPGIFLDFTVTIRPVSRITNLPLSKMICSGNSTAILLQSNVAGSNFIWTSSTSSPLLTGAFAGSGNMIADVLTNASDQLQTADYHIISSISGCPGDTADYIVSVNAVPRVTFQPPAQSICSGQTTSVNFLTTTPGTVFSWDTAATLGAPQVTGQTSGNGNVLVQTLFIAGSAPGSVVYIVQPSVNGCPGIPDSLTITVNPNPSVTFTQCFDNPTQDDTRPIKLRGGIPLNGTYSGTGVSNGFFDPSIAGAGIHQITYTSVNSYGCSKKASQNIRVMASGGPFACGNTLVDVRDNRQYRTVQIGSQCWMASNLEYGNQISSYSMQRDNCIPEKYCYQDNASGCNKNGGLYQWDELMRYEDLQGIQGMCPPGWHIPDEAEWNALLSVYNGPAFAGASLKMTGNSGYNADFPGQRFMNVNWNFRGFATHFWSSSSHTQFKAWAHAMNNIDPSVSWYPAQRNNAFPVRCVKD